MSGRGRVAIGDPVCGREDCLPHGLLRGGLAAPEHTREPVVLHPARIRRAVTGVGIIGPEAEGELIVVAVGPETHEVIGDQEADFEIPPHVGQPVRDLVLCVQKSV